MTLVRSVEPLDTYRVRIEFSTGDVKEIDLDSLLRGPIFEPLRQDAERFRRVRVDEELGAIVWDNGADIDPDVLYGTHMPAWAEPEPANGI